MLLDVVVAKRAVILQLLASPNQTLHIRRDGRLHEDESLDVVDVRVLVDVEGDGLAVQSLDEDLHTSLKTSSRLKSLHDLPDEPVFPPGYVRDSTWAEGKAYEHQVSLRQLGQQLAVG